MYKKFFKKDYNFSENDSISTQIYDIIDKIYDIDTKYISETTKT